MTETKIRNQEVTIRMLRGEERAALELLAERDSSQPPAGDVLGAFAGGELVAAASIGGSGTVADPFRRTDDVRALLARRVAQLRGDGGGGPKLRGLFARRSRAALPSSPPGGGGRLVSLSPPPC